MIKRRSLLVLVAVLVLALGALLAYRALDPGSIRGSTSVRIDAGYRLRIAMAGHDASTFARYPEDGAPVLSFIHSPASPSFLELPVASD